jgi:hypothetical protein
VLGFRLRSGRREQMLRAAKQKVKPTRPHRPGTMYSLCPIGEDVNNSSYEAIIIVPRDGANGSAMDRISCWEIRAATIGYARQLNPACARACQNLRKSSSHKGNAIQGL